MDPPDALSSAFLARAPASSLVARASALELELRARCDAALAEWPSVLVEPQAFMGYLAARSGSGLPALERATDLYIACACAEGVPSAIDAFRRRYLPVVARAIARIDPSEAFLDDVMQALAIKFFVRAGNEPPGIAQYAGRSSLRSWVSTAAARTALNLRRRKVDRGHDDFGSSRTELRATGDPELLLLKSRYKSEFETAIRVAMTAISAKERTLLLLQLRDGLTLPQLATIHKVSRATIARWLASARETLLEQTRRELTRRLQLSPSEYESLVALVRSQLDVTLTTLVR
jgi:RNA polymerase sigma-70 factor, ECF subfamily